MCKCTVNCSRCTVYRRADERERVASRGRARACGGEGRSVEKRHLSFRGRRAAIVRYCASPGGHPFATIATAAAARPSTDPPRDGQRAFTADAPPPPPPPPILNLSTSDRRPSAESVSLTGRATFPPPRARRAVRAYTSATAAVGEEATHEELLHGGGGAHHHLRRRRRRRRRSGLVVTVSGRRFVVP